MIVADSIAEWLAEKDIKHAFGIIGAGNVRLFDSISRLGKTELVCVHHEQAAVMAAAAYYRVSGRLSVVLVTTGAGSTNAVTGIVSAYMDSIPTIIISGNEPTYTHWELRAWGVQGFDSVCMMKKITKFAHMIQDARTAKHWLEYGLSRALLRRFGPVWLDIPTDIQAAQC
jgi:acetolactate synthase-1/2/3 large subunit